MGNSRQIRRTLPVSEIFALEVGEDLLVELAAVRAGEGGVLDDRDGRVGLADDDFRQCARLQHLGEGRGFNDLAAAGLAFGGIGEGMDDAGALAGGFFSGLGLLGERVAGIAGLARRGGGGEIAGQRERIGRTGCHEQRQPGHEARPRHG